MSIKPKVTIRCMIPCHRLEPWGKSIRECLGRTAILTRGNDQTAMAVMLNNKGEKTHMFKVKGVFKESDKILDLAVSDHRNGGISTLFTLGARGSLLIFVLSKNSKVLSRNISMIYGLNNEEHNNIGASGDGKYVIVKISGKFTIKILQIHHHRKAEFKAVLSPSLYKQAIYSLGFYPIRWIEGFGDAESSHLRVAYVVHQNGAQQGLIDFFVFNAETGKIRYLEHLNGKFELHEPYKTVFNHDGGNWVVTSGKDGRVGRARIVSDQKVFDD